PGLAPRSNNLTYHNGPVMTAGTYVAPIYWGTTWSGASDTLTGLDRFYGNVHASSYMGTNTEYTDLADNPVSAAVTFGGHAIDTSAAPPNAPSTSAVLNEVAKQVGAGAVTLRPDGYYPVNVDTKRGNAGYCAWHSWGTITGVQVQFGFVFNLDG